MLFIDCSIYSLNRIYMYLILLFWQGAGTAIGELPPYFMARAARLSGADLDSDDFEEIEELLHEKQSHPEEIVSQISHHLLSWLYILGLLLVCHVVHIYLFFYHKRGILTVYHLNCIPLLLSELLMYMYLK